MQAAAAVVLMTVSAACSDSAEPLPVILPSGSGAEAQTERAVLVYMLADNSLGRDGFDRQNLADMIQACRDGVFGPNRLLVYHDDRLAPCPMLKEVTPMGLRILKEYDEVPFSVAPQRMEEVIADFKSAAPAGRYGLILWSHATGWLVNGENVPQGVDPLWFGEDRGRYMNIPVLADVLEGKGFDYVYFDCCHMASVEALYQLRDVASTFAGSCAELPAAGMPYRETLPCLMATDADLVGAASATFRKYDLLEGIDRTATMSVIDAGGLDRLASAAREFYATRPTLPAGYVPQAFERPKAGGEPCYLFDLQDYADALYFNSRSDAATRKAYAGLLMAMDDCILYRAATPYIFNSVRVDAHCGLSTFILHDEQDADTKRYRSLDWYADVASALFD